MLLQVTFKAKIHSKRLIVLIFMNCTATQKCYPEFPIENQRFTIKGFIPFTKALRVTLAAALLRAESAKCEAFCASPRSSSKLCCDRRRCASVVMSIATCHEVMWKVRKYSRKYQWIRGCYISCMGTVAHKKMFVSSKEFRYSKLDSCSWLLCLDIPSLFW